jgi:hypothetical protein
MDTADIPPAPRTEFVYEAIVDIAERQPLGRGPLGERYIVPIVGGRFAGPGLAGAVLPGGADRQLWRPDGVRELDALYELRCDDGSVLTVHNQVLIDDHAPGGRYAMSQLRITAPEGPHAWLSRRVLVGTLQPLAPACAAVRIRVYQLL